MRRAARPAALVLLAVMAFDAHACITHPPRTIPSPGELARTADLVAIVRVERIEPLSAEEQASLQRLLSDPSALDAGITVPAPAAHFSTVRVLKGKLPAGSLLQDGATSCDVGLLENQDYVIFADLPTVPGGRIVPLYGTFLLDGSARGQARLAEVESSLTHSDPIQP